MWCKARGSGAHCLYRPSNVEVRLEVMHPDQHTASFRCVAPHMEDSVSFVSHICDHHDQTLNLTMMLSAAHLAMQQGLRCMQRQHLQLFLQHMAATQAIGCCWVSPQTCSASSIASCAAGVSDVPRGLLTLSSNNKPRSRNALRDKIPCCDWARLASPE